MVGSGSATAWWKLQPPSARPRLDEVVHEGPGAVLEQGDLLGGEDRVEQLAEVLCSGGSICSGMSGRTWPMATASMPELKTSGVVEHVAHVASPPTMYRRSGPIVLRRCARPAPASRSSLNSGCGWARASEVDVRPSGRSESLIGRNLTPASGDGVGGPHGGLLGRDDGRRVLPRRDAVLGLGGRPAVVVDLGPVRVVELVEREAGVEAVVEALVVTGSGSPTP